MRSIKNHGALKRFQHYYIGMNSRLDSLQAAIILIKFKYFKECLENRNKVAKNYSKQLKHLEDKQLIKLPKTLEHNYHVWAQYSIILKDKVTRDKIFNKLKENNINPSIFYPTPLHTQKCFKNLGYKEADLPVTNRVCNTVINLPCYGELKEEEQEYICQIFSKIVQEN